MVSNDFLILRDVADNGQVRVRCTLTLGGNEQCRDLDSWPACSRSSRSTVTVTGRTHRSRRTAARGRPSIRKRTVRWVGCQGLRR